MKESKKKKELKAWKLLLDLTDSGHKSPYILSIGFHTFRIEVI